MGIGTENGGYIDDLVIAHLERNVSYALQEVAGKTRSEAFLKLDRDQQRHHIEDALELLRSQLVPDGYVYVVLPKDCLRYKKNGSNIQFQNIPSSNGKNPICCAFEEIDKEIIASGSIGKMVALFYNEDAKEKFEGEIRKKPYIISFGTTELSILGGNVLLYPYTVSKPLEFKSQPLEKSPDTTNTH